jgi:hypothetical protein
MEKELAGNVGFSLSTADLTLVFQASLVATFEEKSQHSWKIIIFPIIRKHLTIVMII